MSDTPTRADCGAEIEALHDLFTDLYTGRTTGLDRLDAALAPSFTMVAPGGETVDRAAVVETVADRADSYEPGEFAITIENVTLIDAGPTHAVARYDERQHTPDGETVRRSTAVFRVAADAPAGLVWLTVHETWAD